MANNCQHTAWDKLVGAILVYAIAVATVDLVVFVHGEISHFMGEHGRFIPLPFPELWLDRFTDVFPERFLQFEGLVGIIIVLFFVIVMKGADFLNKPKDK